MKNYKNQFFAHCCQHLIFLGHRKILNSRGLNRFQKRGPKLLEYLFILNHLDRCIISRAIVIQLAEGCVDDLEE